MPKAKDASPQDPKDNLRRYARLVWKIFVRTEEENKTKRDQSLKDDWEKRFDDEE